MRSGSIDRQTATDGSRRPLDILIVDDHKLFTAGLAAILALLDRPVAIVECDNGQRALTLLEAGTRFDLMLLDIEMPSINGVDLLRSLTHRGLHVRTMVVSAESNDRQIAAALAAGARGFFPKSLSPPLMLKAIETVLAGHRYLPDHLQDRIASTPVVTDGAPSSLTARQQEILQLMERGLSNKQIAGVLDVSLSTVKFHVTGLFRELGVRTRTECVHVARQRDGLVS